MDSESGGWRDGEHEAFQAYGLRKAYPLPALTGSTLGLYSSSITWLEAQCAVLEVATTQNRSN